MSSRGKPVAPKARAKGFILKRRNAPHPASSRTTWTTASINVLSSCRVIVKAGAQLLEIRDVIELNHADCSLDPHVLHSGSAPASQESSTQTGCNFHNLLQPGLALEQIKGSVGCRAGKRIRHEGRPMH
jgi:hypothetical protein